jgi:hypothetical protein
MIKVVVLIGCLVSVSCGCSNRPDKPSANGYSDSAVITLHDCDNYTIRQGNVEIQAVCRYTTYNTKGQDKAFDDHCLKALPVGQEIKVKRGEGDWLFANWETDNTQWHMGLNVGKEELKK